MKEKGGIQFNCCIYGCLFCLPNLFPGCCQTITEASYLLRCLCSLSLMIHFFVIILCIWNLRHSISASEQHSPFYYCGRALSPRWAVPDEQYESVFFCCVRISGCLCSFMPVSLSVWKVLLESDLWHMFFFLPFDILVLASTCGPLSCSDFQIFIFPDLPLTKKLHIKIKKKTRV